MRTVAEWFGKTDDAAIPQSVKLRIWARCQGRCGLSGVKIQVGDAYDFDHIKAIWEGGQHRETNLHIVHRARHREKSAADQTRQAKADRTGAKHLGMKPKSKSGFRGWRKMDGTPVFARDR